MVTASNRWSNLGVRNKKYFCKRLWRFSNEKHILMGNERLGESMGCMEIGFQEQQVAPLSNPTDAYKETLGGILPPDLHGS